MIDWDTSTVFKSYDEIIISVKLYALPKLIEVKSEGQIIVEHKITSFPVEDDNLTNIIQYSFNKVRKLNLTKERLLKLTETIK